MKIRHATTAILASCILLAGSGAFAQQSQKDEHDGHHPQDQGKPPATKAAPVKPSPVKPSAGMGMMDQQMKSMREQMDRIHSAKDPKERQRLMVEHMTSMQQMMKGMQGMMGQGAKSGAGSTGMRMDMLERRMDMMLMMMENMMGHQRALEEAPK